MAVTLAAALATSPATENHKDARQNLYVMWTLTQSSRRGNNRTALTQLHHAAHFQISDGQPHDGRLVQLFDFLGTGGQHVREIGENLCLARPATAGGVTRFLLALLVVPESDDWTDIQRAIKNCADFGRGVCCLSVCVCVHTVRFGAGQLEWSIKMCENRTQEGRKSRWRAIRVWSASLSVSRPQLLDMRLFHNNQAPENGELLFLAVCGGASTHLYGSSSSVSFRTLKPPTEKRCLGFFVCWCGVVPETIRAAVMMSVSPPADKQTS